jgi:predicted nucleic acid-binding protein
VKTIVCDSTCLIAFERIGTLDVLPKLFGSISIPPAVDSEFDRKFDWLNVEILTSAALSDVLKLTLGSGESEAIALAIQMNCQLITDDKQARSIARELSVEVKGTIGLLIRAKQEGIINKIKPILEEMESNGFHIGRSLREEAFRIAGETL